MPTVIHKIFEVVKPDMIAEEYYKKGLMLEENKLPGKAKAAYIEVLRINKNHTDALRRISSIDSEEKPHYVSETTIKIGTLEKYTDKGFGFIAGEDGIDYFVHQNSFEEWPTTHIGDRVAFLVVNSPKGVQALAVRII